MKKFLPIVFTIMLFCIFTNKINAIEYYDKDADILLIIDETDFNVVPKRKAEKIGLNSIIYDCRDFMFSISRLSYDEMGNKLKNTGENFDYWFSNSFGETKYPIITEKAFLSDLEVSKTIIHTYDSEYIYQFNFYTHNNEQNLHDGDYYMIVAEAKYQYMKTNHSNSNPPEYKNGMIVINNKKGIYIRKVDFTNITPTSYLNKSLVNIIGIIIITMLGIGILIYKCSKHIKINFINIIGIGLIIFQIFKCFSINPILLLVNKINPSYIIINFLYGIIGLILLFLSLKSRKAKKVENATLINAANTIINKQSEQKNYEIIDENISTNDDLKTISIGENNPSYITARQILGYGHSKLYDPIIVLAAENGLLFLVEIEDKVTEFQINYTNITNITVKNNLKFSEELEVNISKVGTLAKHWINLRTIEKPLPWIFINTQQFRDSLTRPKAKYKTETIPSWEITIEYGNEKLVFETFNNPDTCLNDIEMKRNTNI